LTLLQFPTDFADIGSRTAGVSGQSAESGADRGRVITIRGRPGNNAAERALGHIALYYRGCDSEAQV
jgi:hypothetical protein